MKSNSFQNNYIRPSAGHVAPDPGKGGDRQTIIAFLNDLKASQFLSRDNTRIRPTDNYPGLFISSQTLWNICELMDAFQFSREELKQAALEGLDFKYDGCGKNFLKEFRSFSK